MKNLLIKINQFIEKGLLYIFIAFACINILVLAVTNIYQINCLDYIWQTYIEYIGNNVFTNESQDFLINVLSILSGFVITIISVFGIGYSRATIKICEEGLEEEFCQIARKIIYVSVVLLTIFVFGYELRRFEIFKVLLFLSLIFIVIRFMFFCVVVIKMFDYNMQNAKKEFEENDNQSKEVIRLLKKIANEDIDIGEYERSKAYSEKIRNSE